VFLFDHQGKQYLIDESFKHRFIRKVKNFNFTTSISTADMNNNGQEEIIVGHYYKNTISIADKAFRHIAQIEIPSNLPSIGIFSIYKREGKSPIFVIPKGDDLYFVSYAQNPLWIWRFPLYSLMYAAVFSFLLLLVWVQRENIKQKLMVKQEIKELQYKVITSQLNPHFTFNALNSLAHAVYDPDKPELYDMFTGFARLVRTMLSDTDKNARTLKSELELTTDFLNIQQYRFSGAFTYSINISPEVNNEILIPKLIVQLFAENAVKHAFPNDVGRDHISIEVNKLPRHTEILIIDNGIGRKEANKRKSEGPDQSTGIGIKVMNEFIALLNNQNRQNINIRISDIFSNKHIAGTMVKVLIPDKYNYK
jgi:anti-sigma regulatory factor (Ser/Thr protein kinase)